MIRALVLTTALVLAATPALAQTREKLPPLNGVAVGATLSEAQAKLGAAFEEGTAADEKMTNTLTGTASLYGRPFAITYVFADGGRFDEANAVASIPTDDLAACRTHWTQVLSAVTSQMGKPDSLDDKSQTATPNAHASFDFKDGGVVEMLMLGCLIQLSWLAKG